MTASRAARLLRDRKTSFVAVLESLWRLEGRFGLLPH